MTATKEEVVNTIDALVVDCQEVMSRLGPDKVIQWEIDSLKQWRDVVQQHWPLSDNEKGSLTIGMVASRNLADWVPKLADSIMQLDYSLKHDGDHLSLILPG